ncbi:hypothetical protein CC86DRAFT_373150 [Ophiobolus disseminans]|uniref:Uncharacterized protein n=1 Tax=Ophiobolus disseminans TaxID=1469910 RepID=A0A6A6ZR30_9PLEO|nr:hypothetical protein CC86DRAFT_373150 [Ophiobolus disseminans]
MRPTTAPALYSVSPDTPPRHASHLSGHRPTPRSASSASCDTAVLDTASSEFAKTGRPKSDRHSP